MKKRIIIGTVISISMCFIFIIANLYIDYNLRKYSVYYAHNMEHKEGTHPEMAMALENMDVIYKPNKKNIRYRDDGGFIIYNTFSIMSKLSLVAILEQRNFAIFIMILRKKATISMKPSDWNMDMIAQQG